MKARNKNDVSGFVNKSESGKGNYFNDSATSNAIEDSLSYAQSYDKRPIIIQLGLINTIDAIKNVLNRKKHNGINKGIPYGRNEIGLKRDSIVDANTVSGSFKIFCNNVAGYIMERKLKTFLIAVLIGAGVIYLDRHPDIIKKYNDTKNRIEEIKNEGKASM